jgi:hypothetical protein
MVSASHLFLLIVAFIGTCQNSLKILGFLGAFGFRVTYDEGTRVDRASCRKSTTSTAF